MKKEAYIDNNTPELRRWLRSLGLTPVVFPESDKPGLTAPYPDCLGDPGMYRDGLRYDTDDDYGDFIICEDEEEFKEKVLKIINS